MEKNYKKPQWTWVILMEQDILTLSLSQVVNLREGENEIGNWWDIF